MVAWTNEICPVSHDCGVVSREDNLGRGRARGWRVVLGAPQMVCHAYPRVFTPPSSSMIPDVLPILGHALSASPR